MRRTSVPIRRAIAVLTLAFAVVLGPNAARADGLPTLWFAGTRLILERPQLRDGEVAVASNDAGLTRFLTRLGATLSYAPGQRYVVISSSDRRTIRFTLGDARVDAGGVVTSTPFAPYSASGAAYLPLFSLARALYVQPIPDGRDEVLQPQFGGLDVRSDARSSTVVLHAADPLVLQRGSADRLVFSFTGVGSGLDVDRMVNAPGLTSIHVQTSGPARNPTTTVSFQIPPGATTWWLRPIRPTRSKSRSRRPASPSAKRRPRVRRHLRRCKTTRRVRSLARRRVPRRSGLPAADLGLTRAR